MIFNFTALPLQKAVRYVKSNALILSFFLMFSIGIFFGVISLRTIDDIHLSLAFQQFFDFRCLPLLDVLSGCFIVCVFPLFLLYCFGLFLYGYIPCFILLFFEGLGYGTVSGYFYKTYSIKGVSFVLLVILPIAFLGIVLQFVACKSTVQFSVLLSKNYFRDILVVNPSSRLKQYHIKYLILFVFAFSIACLDCILSRAFINAFGF